MTEPETAVAATANVTQYSPDALAAAYTNRTLRRAIGSAVGHYDGVSQFTTADLRAIARALDVVVDDSMTAADLRSAIASRCGFDADATAAAAFTSDQLAAIAVRLVRQGELTTDADDEVADDVLVTYGGARQAIRVALGVALPLGIVGLAGTAVPREAAVAVGRALSSGTVKLLMIVLVLVLLLVLITAGVHGGLPAQRMGRRYR